MQQGQADHSQDLLHRLRHLPSCFYNPGCPQQRLSGPQHMLVMLRISGQASDLPARLLPGSTMPLTRPGRDFPVDAGFFRLMPLVWQMHSVQRCPLNVVLCRQIFTTAKAEVVRLLVWLGTDASMPEQRERERCQMHRSVMWTTRRFCAYSRISRQIVDLENDSELLIVRGGDLIGFSSRTVPHISNGFDLHAKMDAFPLSTLNRFNGYDSRESIKRSRLQYKRDHPCCDSLSQSAISHCLGLMVWFIRLI